MAPGTVQGEGRTLHPETRRPCLWIAAKCPAPLERIGQAVQQLLETRQVPSALVSATLRGGPPGAVAASSDGELIDYLADSAGASARPNRTLVVTGPLLDADGVSAVRGRVGRVVRICVDPAVVDGGPAPIPTIYWFVQGSQILEAAIPPRAEESGDQADIVVGGALRSPVQLAQEIVDALVRTGWLTAPAAVGGEASQPIPETASLLGAAPGPLLAVRAAR